MYSLPCVLVVGLTGSRAAYVALIMTVGLYWSIGGLRSKMTIGRSVALFLIVILAAAVVYTVSPGETEVIDDGLSRRLSAQAYDTKRFSDVYLGAQIALDHPLGIGPGAFAEAEGNNPHNTPVAKALDGPDTPVQLIATKLRVRVAVHIGDVDLKCRHGQIRFAEETEQVGGRIVLVVVTVDVVPPEQPSKAHARRPRDWDVGS